MTPERQRWWDSLPKEERKVREQIKFLQENIKICKTRFDFIWYEFEDTAIQQMHISFTREEIYRNKYLIKALRKQIAMRPITKRANGDDYRKCPHCGRYLWRIEDDIYYDYPPKYCEDCGQKLRWA